MVEAEAILENPDILHHYVLMGCTEKWPAHLHGKPIHAGTAMSKCGMILSSSQWGAWAPGKVILRPPSWLGKPIGRDPRLLQRACGAGRRYAVLFFVVLL